MTKTLKCTQVIKGFTVGNSYVIITNESNKVTTVNDLGNLVAFNKVEGDNDFKNNFIIIT